MIRALFLAIVVVLTAAGGQFIFHIPPAAPVTCTYYVDPDWGGTASGTASQPWTSLSSSQWTTINSALASADVYVCFSAREAGSDTNEATTTGLHLSRTDTSTHRLTVDGMSKYNTTDYPTTPSWTSYPARTQTVTITGGTSVTGYAYGGSYFEITAGNPIDTTQVKQSYITIRGFKLINSENQCLWYWNGDHILIEYFECTRNATGSAGPGMYFVGQREDGQPDPCVANGSENCDGITDLEIRYGYVHETRGEGIYFAGCAAWATCPYTKTNTYNLHHTIIVNAGWWEGEGDAVDVKTALQGVTVSDMYIRFTSTNVGTPRTCVETLSGITIQRVYCDGNSITQGPSISLTDFWSFYDDSGRAGSIVRNNILINPGLRGGIYCWGDTSDNPVPHQDFTGLLIDNNSVYTGVGDGPIFLGTLCTTATVRNNIAYSTGGSPGTPGNFSSGTLSVHSNNLFYKASGNVVTNGGSNYTAATVTTFEATALASDPLFVSTSAPYAPANFQIQSGSPAKEAGAALGWTPAIDFFGTSRPQSTNWDMGAHER